MRLNFRYEDLLKLGEDFKSAIQGRMRWGDTLFLTLGRDENKCLVVWTPKETSERDHLPGFYTDDGKFFMKVKEKPGAWVTYADLGQIRRRIESEQNSSKTPRANARRKFDDNSSEPTDTLDKSEQEVLQGVRELERNTKNIVDFAAGVVPEFTVTHRGRSIKLGDLLRRPEELNVELRLLRSFKTGAYIVISPPENTENSISAAEVIIPEKTISAGVHLNSDELISRLSNGNESSAIALYSSHLRRYPDFQDFQHFFHLREQLEEAKVNAPILIGEAIHDPLNRNGITIRAFTVEPDNKKIEPLIADAEKTLSGYFEKVNEKIASISETHQGRVRERVGMWNVGRNIISSIIDEAPSEEQTMTQGNPAVQRIVSEETKFAIQDFMDFTSQLFNEHFQPQKSEQIIQELKNYQEQINIAGEEKGTISSNDLNNFIGKATALIHDGMIEEQFIQTGAITPIDVEIFEGEKEISQIDFPVTASWEIEEMPETLSLSETQKHRHAELLSQTLDLENIARRFGYGLREVLGPLYDILLSVNFAGELEIDSETFAQTVKQIKFYGSDIHECILNAPSDYSDYYPKLSIIINKGELRELLCDRVGYFEGMTLSKTEEVNELLTSIQNGELIELDDREQNQLVKNLETEIEGRTGKKIARFRDEKLLTIYCDEVLSAIKVSLQDCMESLNASVKDLTETMNLDDKQLLNKLKRRYSRGKGRSKNRGPKLSAEDIYAERQRINLSLEQIIDGKAVLQDCLSRLEHHQNVVPQLLEQLRTQPDLPILKWPEEEELELPIEQEPELPIVEETETQEEEVEEIVPVLLKEELEVVESGPKTSVEELPSEVIPEVPPIDEEVVTPEIKREELLAEPIEQLEEPELVVELEPEVESPEAALPTEAESPSEQIEEPEPVVTPEAEIAPPEEALPEEEIPSIEELQKEFPALSSKEISEAVEAGLSGQELREYLELRVETAKEAIASASEAKAAQPTQTWQERINIEQYPNIRAFLQEKQLKLTTTGRQLSSLKRVSEDTSREGQILAAEILELRENEYSQEIITALISHMTEELSRWGSEDITEQRLPNFTRQRVLSFYVCYEQDVEDFLDIVTKYENLIDDESPLQPEYKELEEKYFQLIETL